MAGGIAREGSTSVGLSPSWRRWAFRLAVWLVAAVVASLVVLNYGFANLAIGLGGVNLPVAHLLLGVAVIGLAVSAPRDLLAALKHPVVLAWLALLAFSLPHLLLEFPRYGMWALRDASFVLEGGMLVVGLVIAKRMRSEGPLLRALALLFLLNFAYALTFPFRDTVAALSPVSGVFKPVLLLGSYSQMALILVVGALFFLLLGGRATGWNPRVVAALAVAQGAWSFVFQSRTMYLGAILACLLLWRLAGWRQALRGFAVLVVSGFVLVTALSFSPLPVRGRLAPVDLRFTVDHWVGTIPGVSLPRSVLSVLPAAARRSPGTDQGVEGRLPEGKSPDQRTGSEVAEGSTRWRLEIWSSTLHEWWDGGWSVRAFGGGFGRPLTEWRTPDGTVVRQPHNIVLTVLARLGVVGLGIWMALHGLLLAGVGGGALGHGLGNGAGSGLAAWLVLFLALGMCLSQTQPWLEFTYGAVPFYGLLGVGLGLSRRGAAPSGADTGTG